MFNSRNNVKPVRPSFIARKRASTGAFTSTAVQVVTVPVVVAKRVKSAIVNFVAGIRLQRSLGSSWVSIVKYYGGRVKATAQSVAASPTGQFVKVLATSFVQGFCIGGAIGSLVNSLGYALLGATTASLFWLLVAFVFVFFAVVFTKHLNKVQAQFVSSIFA